MSTAKRRERSILPPAASGRGGAGLGPAGAAAGQRRSPTQRLVPGVQARATSPEAPESREIKGSTTVVELLRMFPDGQAAALFARLSMACAHCSGAFHEPLTMAAKRHRRDPRSVIEAFRALDEGGPSAEQIEAAVTRVA